MKLGPERVTEQCLSLINSCCLTSCLEGGGEGGGRVRGGNEAQVWRWRLHTWASLSLTSHSEGSALSEATLTRVWMQKNLNSPASLSSQSSFVLSSVLTRHQRESKSEAKRTNAFAPVRNVHYLLCFVPMWAGLEWSSDRRRGRDVSLPLTNNFTLTCHVINRPLLDVSLGVWAEGGGATVHYSARLAELVLCDRTLVSSWSSAKGEREKKKKNTLWI